MSLTYIFFCLKSWALITYNPLKASKNFNFQIHYLLFFKIKFIVIKCLCFKVFSNTIMRSNKGNLLKTGTVYWITGLSGSGKTTLSKKLTKYLFKSGKKVVKLDGDELREVLDKKYSHTRNERLKIAMTYARLVKMLSNQGYDVVIATISLFREVHKWNKLKNKNLVNIFLDVPIEELKKRDPKKIYKNSQKNKMIAGISFKVDIPLDPNVHILWKNGMNENILFQNVLKQLNLKKKK